MYLESSYQNFMTMTLLSLDTFVKKSVHCIFKCLVLTIISILFVSSKLV